MLANEDKYSLSLFSNTFLSTYSDGRSTSHAGGARSLAGFISKKSPYRIQEEISLPVCNHADCDKIYLSSLCLRPKQVLFICSKYICDRSGRGAKKAPPRSVCFVQQLGVAPFVIWAITERLLNFSKF